MNSQLEGKNYLMGDSFTVADAYLFTVANWGKHVGIDISALTHLGAYMAPHCRAPGGAGGAEGRRADQVRLGAHDGCRAAMRWPLALCCCWPAPLPAQRGAGRGLLTTPRLCVTLRPRQRAPVAAR